MKQTMGGGKIRLVVSFLLLLTVFSPQHKLNQMELTLALEKEAEMQRFISSNFRATTYSLFSPVFPYHVDLINKVDIKFYGVNTIRCWATKVGASYSFFLLIKDSVDLKNCLDQHIGQPDMVMNLSTDLQPKGDNTFRWTKKDSRYYVDTYSNILKEERYANCNLLIVSNVKHNELPLQKKMF